MLKMIQHDRTPPTSTGVIRRRLKSITARESLPQASPAASVCSHGSDGSDPAHQADGPFLAFVALWTARYLNDQQSARQAIDLLRRQGIETRGDRPIRLSDLIKEPPS